MDYKKIEFYSPVKAPVYRGQTADKVKSAVELFIFWSKNQKEKRDRRRIYTVTTAGGDQDAESRTLEEVGNAFNVTRERVRQIEAKALRKLRHPARMSKLAAYL